MAKTLEEGIALVKEGALDEAITIFKTALKKEKNNALAYLWLAKCHILDGETKKAQQAFRSAVEYGEGEVLEEARLQLRSMAYNKWLNLLVFDAPLRVLLIISVIGYMFSFVLETLGVDKAISQIVGEVSIYGILSLFFIWAFFIIAYLLGQLAFDKRLKGRLVLFARTSIAIAGILVIPANLLVRHGLGVIILAIILDVFLFSLFLSRVFDWLGKKMTGESSPIVWAFLSQFSAKETQLPFDSSQLQEAKIPIKHNESNK